MRIGSIVLFAICAVQTPLFAQQKTPNVPDASNSVDASSLQTTSRARVPLDGAIVGSAHCDANGNVYVRIQDAESSMQRHASSKLPIQRIGPDGKLAGAFSYKDAVPDVHARDFFVTDDGEVYVEVYSLPTATVFVLRFSSDGSLRSTIQPDAGPFSPRQIVVFKSGEFLLSGTNGESHHTPFTAVFDASGRLIKEVKEPEDEYARQRAALGDRDFLREGTSWDNTSVVHGDATLGSDGNAYLLRATSPALIYVISPKGDVVRKLKIDSPSGLVARKLKAARGKLAISFLESDSTMGVLKIVDLQGNLLATHVSDDRTTYPGLPGCYDGQSFRFLNPGDSNEVTIQRAEPK